MRGADSNQQQRVPPPSPDERTRTVRFNRACAAAGLAFLLLTVWARWWWSDRRDIPQWQDFPQYYMGGVIAAERAWDAMYPIPHAGSRFNAGFDDHSTMRPRYRELALERGLSEHLVRYIQPPPLTLLLAPLALLPFRFSILVWHTLLALAAFGVGVTAAEMYRLSRGGTSSRTGGLLILLVCCSPIAHRWVRVGNMSAVVGGLIGYAMLELARRDGPRGAAALVLGAMSKYAILVLAPLYLSARRWRTIAWAVAMTGVWVGLSLLFMGSGPFVTFATEVVPTLGRSSGIVNNQALYAFVRSLAGLREHDPTPHAMDLAFAVVRAVSFAGVVGLVLARGPTYWRRAAHVFAGGAALVSWLLIFSPIFWEHYQAYLTPFWGWLAYEAARSRARAALALLAIGLAFAPWDLALRYLHLPTLPNGLAATLLWSAVLMHGLAIATLMRRPAGAPA